MYCPNCSAEAPQEQKFCRSCGFELDAVASLISDQTNIAKPQTPKQTLSGRERAMLIWGMILSLTALAAGSSLKILWNEHIQVAGEFSPYLVPIKLKSEVPPELSSEQPSVTEQTTKFLEESEARIAV